MDIVCEFCDKSFDSKSNENGIKELKNVNNLEHNICCRKCSSAILGMTIIYYFMLRTAMEQLQFCTKK